MKDSNRIINGMWIGSSISSIEELTIRSFLDHGHEFHLWVYDHKIEVPEIDGLVVRNASDIVSKEYIFSYREKNKFGHGKGSYAGFSDIFRYKLLYEYGGWWVDMDVTCLKPFDFPEPYVFRSHQELPAVGNVMKCPKGAEVMIGSYEQAINEVDSTNIDWHKPIEILNEHIRRNELSEFIQNDLSFADDWRVISKLLESTSTPIDPNYYFIHWLNEEWRARQLSKDVYRYASHLGKLMAAHGIGPDNPGKRESIVNYITTSQFYRNLKLLNVITE